MNKLLLAFIFTTSSVLSLNAQEAQSITDQSAPEYQNYNQTNEQSDQLEKLLKIPEVNAIYEQCSQLKAAGTNLELSDCLWNGSSDGTIEGVANKEDIKAKIASKLSNLDQDKNKKYESINVLPLAKKETESQKKLEEYYYNNMKQQIFGDSINGKNADGTFQVIDHSKFNSIYHNQLTTNILTAISSFCIEADVIGTGTFVFPLLSSSTTGRNKQREKNIKELSKSSVAVTGESVNSTISGAKAQSNKWTECFINTQYVCNGGELVNIDEETQEKTSKTAKEVFGVRDTCNEGDESKKSKCKTLKEDYAYTKTRACELTNYLKVARQNLKAVEVISEGYEKLQKTGGTQVSATGEKPNQNLIRQANVDGKLNSITALTSNEFINQSGFSEGVDQDIAELESCIIKDPETGDYSFAPGAEESCKKYLNTNKEEVESLKAEYALRLRGLSEKVKSIDPSGDDSKGVESFLADQGYTKDEIGQTIEANTDIKALKEQIIARYENEKLELIKSMNEKMDSTSSANDGVIDVVSNGSDSDFDKLIKIHEELSSKTEQYAQLIHFNNIVSGFLVVGKEGEEKGQETGDNTASIKREIANSAFSKDNLEKNSSLSGKYEDQNENIEKSLEANNVKLSDKVEDSATLGVDKINNAILKYDIDTNQ